MLQYSVNSLIATYKAAKKWEPNQPFVKVDWCTTLTAAQWLTWFRKCLQAKINSHLPVLNQGFARKCRPDWQMEASNLAWALSHKLVIRRSHYPLVMMDLAGVPCIANRLCEEN